MAFALLKPAPQEAPCLFRPNAHSGHRTLQQGHHDVTDGVIILGFAHCYTWGSSVF